MLDLVAVVLNVFSRRVVGWSIDASPTATLVTSALDMAIDQRRPAAGAVIHSDHGVQGEFKRLSQHLEMEVDVWDDHGAGRQRRQEGRRCVRRGVHRAAA